MIDTGENPHWKNVISRTYILHSNHGFYFSKFNLESLTLLWIMCGMCHRFWPSVWFILWNVPLNVATDPKPQYLTFKLSSWLLPVKLPLQNWATLKALLALDPAESEKRHLILSSYHRGRALLHTDSQWPSIPSVYHIRGHLATQLNAYALFC